MSIAPCLALVQDFVESPQLLAFLSRSTSSSHLEHPCAPVLLHLWCLLRPPIWFVSVYWLEDCYILIPIILCFVYILRAGW